MNIEKTKLKSEVESTLAKGAGLLMAIRAEDVRGLLEEIERLTSENSSMRGSVKRMGEDASRMQKQARKAQREVHQLKAEVDHLKSGMAAIRIFTGAGGSLLMPHLDALRKDADRYRWLCDGNGYFMEEAGLCGHSNEKQRADQEIDEAMAEEAE